MIEPSAGTAEVDPRIAALLAERTAALARRGVESTSHVATRPFLVCLSGNDRYGLPLESVAQVAPARAYTPVPGSPPELLGLVVLSGRVVSVLSLAGALGRPTPLGSSDTVHTSGHILLLRGGIGPVALFVDRVLSVADVDSALAAAPLPLGGLGADAISGYAPAPGQEAARKGGDADFVVIDLPRLLRRYLPQG
ncbi:chemotaxis protein CheW [Methylobacterium sp. 77]|uniref:chemotaxis protein CheW n=1 Tax=Methylobacterium sp. 77 TaxID=1101192 RepID=UPI00036A5516|nr:chemotaxis protein CheW [Methylobacterium sp. 77]